MAWALLRLAGCHAAGLVTVVMQPEHQPALLARLPEAMFMSPDSAALESALNAADFIVIGPGLGRNGWGENCP